MKSTTTQVARKVFLHSKKAFSLFTLTLLLFTSFFILNQNAEAQQLVCPERAIEQITDETAGTSIFPSINTDGTRIAFYSTSNINGGNPDGNFEIYLFDTTTGIITQITDETAGTSLSPSIDADGTRIAFPSSANINGGNPDGNFEIYLFDVTTMMFTQITDTTGGGNGRPAISADGTRIAFGSNANINGGNPDGNFEIYLFDVTTMMFTQITDEPAGNSTDSSINADGTRIAFESTSNINGGNPDGNFEIYLFDTTTGIITQITDDPTGDSNDPSINADGTRIAFESTSNINGGNPDGNKEIYLFDTTTGIITQITDTTGGVSNNPSINADGTRIAFYSASNINGGNPDGNNEIYLAACFIPEPIPTLSEWGLIAMAGILGIVGFMVIRRRKVTS